MNPQDHFSPGAIFSGVRSRWIPVVLGAFVIAIVALSFRSGKLTFPASLAKTQTRASGSLNITFRDSMTGYAVPTQLTAENLSARTRSALVTDAAGQGRYQLPAGRHNIEAAARGYRPLKTHFEIDPQTPLAVTIWLDPLEPPEELRPEVVAAKLRPGYTMFHGHVADPQSGRPLAGAGIRLENAGVEAQTDERGYFLLYALAPTVNPTGDLPNTDNLVVYFAGFKTYRVANVLLTDGDAHFKIELEQGEGTIERDRGHKMLRSAEELKNSQGRPQESAAGHHLPPQRETTVEGVAQATNVAVPTSIRVGFNCSCATCSSVQVYTLDTYVRLGLDDEWISSWNSNSLKAGAIAFRSYGAYHVFHPRNANYDICSTTCCQVIDPNDSSVNTDNATSATSGVIVVNSAGTEPLFAEYAAENNNNFCADGFTGRPADNWSCLNDFVDAGTTFNGHGRGMCQWGTQRWAVNQGKDWTWIVNHYYNDNGNPIGARSGVLQLSSGDFSLSVTPSSSTVRRNQSTTYTVTVTPLDAFNGVVTFSVTGLPGGASASFNPTSVTGSGTTTMTVTAGNPRGTFTLTITGTSGGLQHSATVTLTVTKGLAIARVAAARP